jgi:hypothetical protein
MRGLRPFSRAWSAIWLAQSAAGARSALDLDAYSLNLRFHLILKNSPDHYSPTISCNSVDRQPRKSAAPIFLAAAVRR